MAIFRQLCIILIVCLAGEFANKVIGIPIPANVLGMIFMLILLLTGIVKLEMIDKITKFLLDHLAFFFIPTSVSLLANLHLIQEQWLAIVSVILLSTVIVMGVTGLTIQLIRKKIAVKEKKTA
ncbi:murein hydrolase effector LrgA [Clostridium aceticum]|uniref:Murein hydrolase effector LrgA n=1 Tax=Clostridium aceticum TaxID=84022 RepID=A0A0D8IAG2_9CLOT|nr:CidA/LrgA family protein [Clostridium aceticum]AKL97181.1 murein hydrolase effector LrgA [Clostridium aceticum]KJF26216.1 hypothetical protein TZ02_13605 [Clostridium aceticum]